MDGQLGGRKDGRMDRWTDGFVYLFRKIKIPLWNQNIASDSSKTPKAPDFQQHLSEQNTLHRPA